MRRMMDKMGLDMTEIPNVQEVIIKTDKKEKKFVLLNAKQPFRS